MESNLQDNLSALPAEPRPTDSTAEAKLTRKPKKEFSSLRTRAEDVLAQEFAEIYEDHFRYDNMRQRWLVWDEHFWRPDENGEVHRAAEKLAKARFQKSFDIPLEIDERGPVSRATKFAIKARSAYLLAATVKRAQHQAPISVTGREFDRDPMLLGVLNSVIDLRADAKQRQRDGQPVDMITKQCPVKFEPDAKCPRWEQFLLEIFEGNQELIDFVQRAMGYSLTGESLEQVFFLLHGRGSNGKSTLLDTIQSLLGSSYSANLDFDALISEYRHRHQFDLANIEGRRFVVASETDRKVELSPKVVKSLVGNGKIVVNEKFKQPRAIEPQHKLWLAVNELPTATDRTDGFWRRILLIPFERQFLVGEKDLMLPKVLLGELPGILNWAVAGCLEWQRAGLDPPRAVTIATTEYHERSDCFYRFITECCIVGTDPNAETTSQALREAYDTWRELNPDAPEDLQGKGLLASIVAQGAVQDRVHTPDGKRVRGVRRVRLLSPRGTVLG